MAIAALKSKGLKPNKQTGFTLVELIVVVGLISMIAIYITIEINQSSDDAKVGIVTAFLVSNVPNAIASYRARNLGTCAGLDTAPTLPDGDTTFVGIEGDEKKHLVLRGLSPNTPWGQEWTATYNGGDENNPGDLTLVIDYPIAGSRADDMKSSIVANIEGQGKIMNVDDSAANSIKVTYNCS